VINARSRWGLITPPDHRRDLALLDKMSVDVLAVLACTCLPLSHGTLIKPKRRHNGLERISAAKQGNTRSPHLSPSAAYRKACWSWPQRSTHRCYSDNVVPSGYECRCSLAFEGSIDSGTVIHCFDLFRKRRR
jgi:hypothetical protein